MSFMAAFGAHVALLRGINVGGRNKLPMKTLVAIFEELGCRDVRTWIQSGNVIFRAPRTLVARLAADAERALHDAAGLSVPVVLRTAAQLGRAVERNPFLAEGADPAHLHVGFLAARPAAARVARMEPDRSPPDRFRVIGGEVYLHCPRGLARTKLTSAFFDSRLGTTITVRNWKTTLRLAQMAAE